MAASDTPTAAAAGTITIGGDLTVNRLGFGAMRITGRGIWGEPSDVDEAKAVLRRAIELDVNFIDTADSYGPEVSENLIAEALHPYPDDLVIATKGGLERPGPGRWPANGRPDHLKEACDGSLRRLRLEQIQLYQFHRPDPSVPFGESIGALLELQREGKIRHIGLSNVSVRQLREAQRLTPIASVQNRYNLADRGSDPELRCASRSSWRSFRGRRSRTTNRTPVVRDLAQRHGATVHQVLLAWLLARSPAMLPIPGTGTVAHLEENVAAAALELSADEMQSLTSAT